MAKTITEKILARASGLAEVKPGQIVTAKVDYLMSNDGTTHISIDIFNRELKKKRVFDPRKVVFVIDHNVPAESVETAASQNKMRAFAEKYNISIHDGEGVCHQILAEQYVNPGQVVIGADSHTCTMGALGAFGAGVGCTDFVAALGTGEIWLLVPETIQVYLTGELSQGAAARDVILKIIGELGTEGAAYKTIEFCGPGVKKMTMDQRFVLCNLAVEAGAKNGIIEPDEKTAEFLESMGRPAAPEAFLKSDPDCTYSKRYEFDLGEVKTGVALPHNVDRYTPLEQITEEIKIDQGFIGSCSNGRLSNLREAAKILKGNKVKPRVRLLIVPASRAVYLAALEEGLIDIFMESGAMVLNPNCSICWGACQGIIGSGEVMVSTGTRNFKGRAGSPDSEVYLASARTVAHSCITGILSAPD